MTARPASTNVGSDSSADGVDAVLASILADIERGGNGNVAEHVARHPDLADEILALVDVAAKVDGSRPEDGKEAPERLGDFTIIRKLDSGGMGEVYEAVQAPLGRRVAIKTIRSGRISTERRARFLREQRILARLHQTHIVPIHAAGQVGELQYFAMAYIDGAPLSRVIKTASTLRTGSNTPSLAALAEMSRRGSPSGDEAISARASSQPVVIAASSAAADPKRKAAMVAPTPTPNELVRPSLVYFRSVAEVVAAAAEAVQHAHEAGYFHRDIKPSNIMVDASGHPWIIDFGLAALADRAPRTPGAAADGADAEAGITRTSSVLGTPAYMAPEQFDGTADAQSDVWGLGAVLYELLTHCRPFERLGAPNGFKAIRERVKFENPPPPRTLVPRLPRDLDAICSKALTKDPKRRYATAADLAADLNRWLSSEPTTALAARPWRRLALWARRNKGWAAALVVFLAATVGVFALTVNATAARAEAAVARADAKTAIAERQVAQLRREQDLERIHAARKGAHRDGWSTVVLDMAAKLVDANADNFALRSHAVAALQGLDARVESRLERDSFGVAFDSTGARLAFGGWGKHRAGTLDCATGKTSESQRAGAGPVAFRKDGMPVQLLLDANGEAALELRSLVADVALARLPLGGRSAGPTFVFAVSDDAAIAAATMTLLASGGGSAPPTTIVWRPHENRRAHAFPFAATALTFSPDGRLLFAGDATGRVVAWSMQTGKVGWTAVVGRTAVQSLAVGQMRNRLEAAVEHAGLQLAAGLQGGEIVLFDCGAGRSMAHCRGSSWDVNALAFHPDGTMLASAGRERVRLWDTATGTELLQLPRAEPINTLSGVRFSADGRRLAFCGIEAFGSKGRVEIWSLENGRGVRTLRGLGGIAVKVRVSPDRKLVAALSQDWQIAVWNWANGELVRRMDVPRGWSADNAGFEFAPDSRQLAFCAGSTALLWKWADDSVRSWTLPRGYQDHLAFAADGRLLAFRFENVLQNGKIRKNVLRVRNLFAADPLAVVGESHDYEREIIVSLLTGNGRALLVDGYDEAGKRWIRALGPDGRALWSMPTAKVRPSHAVGVDPDANKTWVHFDDGKVIQIVDLANYRVLGTFPYNYNLALMGPHPFYFEEPSTTRFVRKRDGKGLFELDVGGTAGPPVSPVPFHAGGLHFTWSLDDGAVAVLNVDEANRLLTRYGLGW